MQTSDATSSAAQGDSAQTVNHWLMVLGAGEGEPLALDEHNQCQLSDIEGNVATVYVPEAGSEVILYADLMRLVKPMMAPFYEEVLGMNMDGALTRGASISFDHEESTLVLFYRQSLGYLDAATFNNAVQGFLVASRVVRERLVEVAQKTLEIPVVGQPQAVAVPNDAMMLRA